MTAALCLILTNQSIKREQRMETQINGLHTYITETLIDALADTTTALTNSTATINRLAPRRDPRRNGHGD